MRQNNKNITIQVMIKDRKFTLKVRHLLESQHSYGSFCFKVKVHLLQ